LARQLSVWRFVLRNVLVWVLMLVILVVVPDQLEHIMPFEATRVIGWAVAVGVWVIVVEQEWRARFGPFVRFGFQLVLWVSAALLASWISAQLKVD
jgi:hypothetical protein